MNDFRCRLGWHRWFRDPGNKTWCVRCNAVKDRYAGVRGFKPTAPPKGDPPQGRPPGPRALTTDVEALLTEFVQWFDKHFPEGGTDAPGFPLWAMAERARLLLRRAES